MAASRCRSSQPWRFLRPSGRSGPGLGLLGLDGLGPGFPVGPSHPRLSLRAGASAPRGPRCGDLVRIHVEVLHPLSHDHQAGLLALRRVRCLGMTALADGVLTGVEMLSGRQDSRQRRLLLLSDGLANQGEIDPKTIARQVQSAAADTVRVSTFGVGDDFNEDLMEALAVCSGGHYAFLVDADAIPAAFASELEGLLRLGAREVKLEVRPAKGVRRLRCPGHGSGVISLGDLACGVHRVVLVELEISPGQVQEEPVAELELSWRSPSGKVVKRERATVMVQFTDKPKRAETSVDHAVVARGVELLAAEAQRQAIRWADLNDFTRAGQIISASTQALGAELTSAPPAMQGMLQAKIGSLRAQSSSLTAQTYTARARKQAHYDAYSSLLGDQGADLD